MRILFNIILFLFSFQLFPQTFHYKNYSVEDGLASSTVYYVLQDSKGYIWFATESGLSRFDGKKFKNYSTNDGLTDNTALAIFKDSRGRLWSITLSGKLFYMKEGRFIKANLEENTVVKYFIESEKDQFWVTTMSSGVIKIKLDSNYNFKILLKNKVEQGGYSASKNKNGEIFYSTYSGIKLIQSDSFYAAGIFFSDSGAHFYLNIAKNGNLITANNSQVLSYDFSTGYSKEIKIKNRNIQFMYTDKGDVTWIASNKGLSYMVNSRDSLYIKNTFFSDQSISGLLEDMEGNFWIATLGNGVYFVPDKNILGLTDREGLADNKINFIIGDTFGKIWMGANNGKINYWQAGKIFNYSYTFTPDISNRVTTMLSHTDGSVWIGKDDGILFIQNNKSLLLNNNTHRDFGSIKTITEDTDGTIYAGTHSTLFKIKANKIFAIKDLGRTTALYVDFNGKLWLCANGNLGYKTGSDFIFPFKNNSLLSQRMYKISQSPDSTLWMATQGSGLVYMKGDIIKNISLQEGLANNICHSFFIEKNNKTIWAATNQGLSKIKFTDWGKNFKITNYSTTHGLLADEINSVYVQNDTVWVATNKGVCFFNENTMKSNMIPPPVYFSNIKIMGKDTLILPEYKLPYDENNLQIEFAGLTYRTAGKVNYKYRLSGVDTNWIFTNNTYVQFPNLSPGDYIFQVSAMNEDGIWSGEPATARFFITPPFWKTDWFIISCIFSFIVFITGIAAWRINKIRKREEQKTLMNNKIAELKLTALRSQMNPHFIFNSLNSIQSLINANEKKSANIYLSKFSELLRSVLELSSENMISLREEIKMLEIYLELEKLRFEDKFDYRFKTDDSIDLDNTLIPSMLIQPYVENAVKHGFNQQTNNGKLLIEMKKMNDYVLCAVEDNGIGREKSAALRKKNLTHNSMGMSITEERLQMLNKSFHNSYSVHIIDLAASNGSPMGTRVEIKIHL